MFERKKIITGLLIMFFTLFYASGCFLAEETKPKDPYLWDFGKAKQDDVLKHTFELKNNSDSELNIEQVRSSCGCTASVISKKNIPPGDVSYIEVSFKTKGYLGEVKQFVYLHTNSQIEPIIKLTVKAEVTNK